MNAKLVIRDVERKDAAFLTGVGVKEELDHRNEIYFIYFYVYFNVTDLVLIRDGNGPGNPRAGPENPGPRALRAETGLIIFYLRFLCALCAGCWVVTRELCIVVTNKCVVY